MINSHHADLSESNKMSEPTYTQQYFDVVLLEYPATCFGHLSGHLQGGIIKNIISYTKVSEPFQH